MNFSFRANIQSILRLGQEAEAGNSLSLERGQKSGGDSLAISHFCLLVLRRSDGMDHREQLCVGQGQLRRIFREDTRMTFSSNAAIKSDTEHFLKNVQIKI